MNRYLISLGFVIIVVGGLVSGCARHTEIWKGTYSREGRTVVLDYEGMRLVYKDILPGNAPQTSTDSGILPPIQVGGANLSSGMATLNIGNQYYIFKNKYKPYNKSNEMSFAHHYFTLLKSGRVLNCEQGTYAVGPGKKPTVTFAPTP